MASGGHGKPQSFSDMINQVETKLRALGPGPHTDGQKEEIKALNMLLEKAKQENRKTPTNTSQQQQPIYAQQIQNSPRPQVSQSQASLATPKLEPGRDPTPEPKPSTSAAAAHNVLDRKRLQTLIKEVDPMTQVEDEVEEVLMQLADEFIDNVVNASCDLARHRNSETLEVKDVQFYLEKHWNMYVPGFASEDLKPYKKAPSTEAHRQRLALIKKAMKKY